jgi:phosphoglycolate phosphatase-like HAD superfamily hydrolase
VADPRTHLVWDWNGTLLNDLALVVACTNAAFASAGWQPDLGRPAPGQVPASGRRLLRRRARKAGYLVRHLAELETDGRSVVLIGDSLDDADAADAAGAACVLYTGGFTDPDRLRACGRPVAETLTEAVRLATTIA